MPCVSTVGSTAVPRLAAKDVIDVQVTVAELDVEALESAFDEADCERFGQFGRDHVPEGVGGPADDWRKLLFGPRPPRRAANIHVRVEGAANARYALLFRDYLRAQPRGAAAYAELKRRLAALDPPLDIAQCSDVKDPACDIVIAAAEEWAEQTAWRPGPSDG